MLTSLRLRNFPESKSEQFPWTLPIVKNFEEIQFTKPVTFFVGENGSGKSTILEAIAAALKVPIAGSKRLEEDPSLAAALDLADYFSIKHTDKTHHGLLARAEDFIGFVRNIKAEIEALDEEIREVKETFTGGDINLTLAAIQGEKESLISRYGTDMEAMSHGEGFLKLFNARITGKGIYLIDEPEAALSPLRQLSLISLILDKIQRGSQFIIATHSPIMMAMPESEVLYFAEDKITPLDYKETDHYKITTSYLQNPEVYLKEL